MTEEQKKVEECKKCECCKMVCKFFFLSGAVFLGTLMALLLAHSLLKPNFPPCAGKMMRPHLGIERQMPQGMYGHPGARPDFNKGPQQRPNFEKPVPDQFQRHQRPDFKGQVPQTEGKVLKLGVQENR